MQTICISECAFADDGVIMPGKEDLVSDRHEWNEILINHAMKVSEQETKVMEIAKEQQAVNIQISGVRITFPIPRSK